MKSPAALKVSRRPLVAHTVRFPAGGRTSPPCTQLYTEKSAYLRSRPEPKPGIGTYTKFRTLPFFAPVISEFSVRLFPVIVRTI